MTNLSKRTTRMTMRTAANIWLEQKAVTASTLKGYKTTVRIINEFIGGRKVSNITALDLEKLLNVSMSEFTLKNGSVGYSLKTKSNVRSVIREIFTYLHKGEYIKKNPCNYTLVINGCAKSEFKRTKPYEKSDIQKLRSVADGSGIVEAAILAQAEGLRPSELIALSKTDTHMVDGIHVLSISRANVLGELKKTKTYLSERKIALKEQSVITLKALRVNGYDCHKNDIEKIEPSSSSKSHDFIFKNPRNGMPWKSVDEYSRQLKKYFVKAGVDYRGIQPLRHTFATKCLDAGVPIDEVAKIMGHASPQMLHEHYIYWKDIVVGKSYREQLSNLGW